MGQSAVRNIGLEIKARQVPQLDNALANPRINYADIVVPGGQCIRMCIASPPTTRNPYTDLGKRPLQRTLIFA